MANPLLAKSRSGSGPITPEITLTGHTACVLRAVDALFGREGSPTRLGLSWLRFFGLKEEDFGRFRRHLRVAAAAHDWGKANDGFQSAVSPEKGKQVVRHEHLSGLMLNELLADKAVVDWLQGEGIDTVVILAAVISHHVKVTPEPSKAGDPHALGAFMDKGTVVRFCSDHPDFEAIWQGIQAEVGSHCPEAVRFPTRWKEQDIENKRKDARRSLGTEHSRLRDDRERRRWVAAVRAGLIVADAVGSAVVRIEREAEEVAGEAIDRWVSDCFATTLTGAEIWDKVTKPRISDLRNRKRWDDTKGTTVEDIRGFNEFQATVATMGPRVLLTAPCGSGKTLAAWNWIKAQFDASDRPLSRVLFLYPTRATATEGFKDYVAWAPEDEAGLLSGTADYELQDMFANPTEPDDLRKGRDFKSEPRLYALGHWKRRIFSATADQFFPFMQYQYGPLCLLPILVESVLVVDEVHSFDKAMFSTLKPSNSIGSSSSLGCTVN